MVVAFVDPFGKPQRVDRLRKPEGIMGFVAANKAFRAYVDLGTIC
ncbi:hypothetical protein [Agrobacterium vitis]|nr:hypothetical protein [Agrobacterium vitis]